MVSGGSKKEGLLEDPVGLCGVPLSLRPHDLQYRADVRRAAAKLRAEDFSAREWQDAFTYLIG